VLITKFITSVKSVVPIVIDNEQNWICGSKKTKVMQYNWKGLFDF